MSQMVVVLLALGLLVGCDPVSSTNMTVRPIATPIDQRDVTRIATRTARQHGLILVEDRRMDMTFRGKFARPGTNIWLTVSFSPNSATIQLGEHYCQFRSEGHKNLAQSLVRDFKTGGYDTEIVYETPDSHMWTLLFGVAGMLWIGLLVRRFVRKSKLQV